MPLTFDEVGVILNDAWRTVKGSRYDKMLQARHTVGKRIFEDLGINQCEPELRQLLYQTDRMMPELNFYAQYPGDILFLDVAPKVVGFLKTACDLSSYLVAHWSELPLNPATIRQSVKSIVLTMQTLQSDADYLWNCLHRDKTVIIEQKIFQTMKNMGTIFCRMTLGDQAALKLMNALNEANGHLKTHALIIQESERIKKKPGNKKDS